MEKFIKWYILFSILIIFGSILYFYIIEPAIWSYENYKNATAFSEALKNGEIGGYFNPSDGKITIFENSTSILRHELCHRQIHFYNISINKLFEEMACYTSEFFFWNKVNLTTKDWQR